KRLPGSTGGENRPCGPVGPVPGGAHRSAKERERRRGGHEEATCIHTSGHTPSGRGMGEPSLGPVRQHGQGRLRSEEREARRGIRDDAGSETHHRPDGRASFLNHSSLRRASADRLTSWAVFHVKHHGGSREGTCLCRPWFPWGPRAAALRGSATLHRVVLGCLVGVFRVAFVVWTRTPKNTYRPGPALPCPRVRARYAATGPRPGPSPAPARP